MFQQPFSCTQQRLLRFGVTPKIYKFRSFRKFDTIIHPVASIQYPVIMLFVKCQCYLLLIHDANMLMLSCSSSYFPHDTSLIFTAVKHKFQTPPPHDQFQWYAVVLLHCAFSFTMAHTPHHPSMTEHYAVIYIVTSWYPLCYTQSFS